VLIPLETWEILDIEDFVIQAAKTFSLNIYVITPSAKQFFAYSSGLTE
jgi:hypothetical protein